METSERKWDLKMNKENSCRTFHGRSLFLGCIVQHVGVLIPQPGMEPVSAALEVQSLSHWTAREVPAPCFFNDFKNVTYRIRKSYLSDLLTLYKVS